MRTFLADQDGIFTEVRKYGAMSPRDKRFAPQLPYPTFFTIELIGSHDRLSNQSDYVLVN